MKRANPKATTAANPSSKRIMKSTQFLRLTLKALTTGLSSASLKPYSRKISVTSSFENAPVA